eukprot:TRINITY_DN42803_c0_g1_i1.p1 TRINITY_DN42803_c0_g1~~TRINITY_DN42803_c0_g1_i1.p1  ORF type:complete len:262 (+),score=44.28 TRINITY_DN42803_c0_g1_i1:52-786(+)
MSQLFVTFAVIAPLLGLLASAAEERRLTTSTQCRTSLDLMLKDPNWKYVNNSATRWCRLRLENEMASCCTVANFAEGKAEGCSDCLAHCMHQNMIDLCVNHFGAACAVRRKPFFKTGAADLEVLESFCVPHECNNVPDRDALITWFAALYVGKRNGWHLDYDEARLECPSDAIAVLIGLAVAVVACLLGIPCGWFLLWAPKEKGLTLISQSDMQAQADDEDEDDGLRQTGMGMDALGNSGMTVS